MKTQNQQKENSGLLNQSNGQMFNIKGLLLMLTLFTGFGEAWAQTSTSPAQTVWVGNEPYLVTLTPGSTYNWTITPGTAGTQWRINGTGNSVTVDWNIAGVYTLTVTERNAQNCDGQPVSVVVTVNPIPNVVDPADQIVCNGTTITAINFTGSVPGTVYSWTNSNPSIGLVSAGSGNIASFNAVNIGTSPVVATITVTPSFTNAGQTYTGTAQSFTITVNPSANVDPVPDASYSNGTTTPALVFTSPVTGTTFSWTNSNNAIGLGASGTGSLPSFTATNTGTSPISAIITVTASANGCVGPARTFTITVNPLPVPTITPSENPVCFGSSGVVYTTEAGMTNYVWVVTGGLVTGGGNSTANTVTVTWNGIGPYSVRVNYTNSFGNSAIVPTTQIVTVTPLPATSPIYHN
jgi:hypothetical protein